MPTLYFIREIIGSCDEVLEYSLEIFRSIHKGALSSGKILRPVIARNFLRLSDVPLGCSAPVRHVCRFMRGQISNAPGPLP